MTAADAESLSYEEARELARDPDPKARAALANRADIMPEVLYYLAEDEDPEVRRVVAENSAAPHQTDILLASDTAVEVRTGLAGKISHLAPGLSADEQDAVRKSTYEALEILARDQLTVVRQVLSETLKDVVDAPQDIISTLAHDTDIEVAGPVLEFSPQLTEEDLIEIIQQSPAQGAIKAISNRKNVQEKVSDAVVATDDIEAIADLLSNDSAQIREKTLDDLIDRASDIDLWHAPLVARPKLPGGAAARMAQFLADNLLDVLQQRTDLDADTLDAVKSVAHERLRGEGSSGSYAAPAQDFRTMPIPVDVAERLLKARKLGEDVLLKAIKASDHSFVLAAIVTRAHIDPDAARRIFVEKSAKGVVAVARKAGISAKLAVQIQQRVARIAPSDVIMAEDDGSYAMTDDEMDFQLEFYDDLAGKGEL